MSNERNLTAPCGDVTASLMPTVGQTGLRLHQINSPLACRQPDLLTDGLLDDAAELLAASSAAGHLFCRYRMQGG
jgi:hypothetical protein